MPVCSLFLKGKASCFKAFNVCRKLSSGCLSWCFSSLCALQTTPCCYFPFFPYPKCSFPTLDTFQYNEKMFCPVQCVVISSEMPSHWRKRAFVCLAAQSPIFQWSCTAHRVLLGSETIHLGGKLVLSWEGSLQVVSRRTEEPSCPTPARGKPASLDITTPWLHSSGSSAGLCMRQCINTHIN